VIPYLLFLDLIHEQISSLSDLNWWPKTTESSIQPDGRCRIHGWLKNSWAYRTAWAVWNQKRTDGVFTGLPTHGIASGTKSNSCCSDVVLTRLFDARYWQQQFTHTGVVLSLSAHNIPESSMRKQINNVYLTQRNLKSLDYVCACCAYHKDS
jgi:hypothetical protein